MGDNRCAFCGDSANYRLLCEQHAREDAEITAMNDNRAKVEFSDDVDPASREVPHPQPSQKGEGDE